MEEQDFQTQFDAAIDKYATDNQYGLSKIPFHIHNGTDSPQVNVSNLAGSITPTSAAIITALGYTPENVAKKVTSVTGASDTNYPSEKAVYTFASGLGVSIAASNDILLKDTTSTVTKSSATPVKAAQFTMPYKGTIRISVGVAYGYYSGNGHYRIYVNGTGVGTQHNFTNSSAYFSDDITINVGDLLQVYVWSDNATYGVTISNWTATYAMQLSGNLWQEVTY